MGTTLKLLLYFAALAGLCLIWLVLETACRISRFLGGPSSPSLK